MNARLKPSEVCTAVSQEPAPAKCRICGCRLNPGEGDDEASNLCASCLARPEARRLGISVPLAPTHRADNAQAQRSARAFTAAERSLIRKVHGFMPPRQLLDILNERLLSDLGPDAAPYTMEQLFQEIGEAAIAPAGGHDWASLRKLLTKARSDGVLDRITERVIDDFAVVYRLNTKQTLTLKDVILNAKGSAR